MLAQHKRLTLRVHTTHRSRDVPRASTDEALSLDAYRYEGARTEHQGDCRRRACDGPRVPRRPLVALPTHDQAQAPPSFEQFAFDEVLVAESDEAPTPSTTERQRERSRREQLPGRGMGASVTPTVTGKRSMRAAVYEDGEAAPSSSSISACLVTDEQSTRPAIVIV